MSLPEKIPYAVTRMSSEETRKMMAEVAAAGLSGLEDVPAREVESLILPQSLGDALKSVEIDLEVFACPKM